MFRAVDHSSWLTVCILSPVESGRSGSVRWSTDVDVFTGVYSGLSGLLEMSTRLEFDDWVSKYSFNLPMTKFGDSISNKCCYLLTICYHK